MKKILSFGHIPTWAGGKQEQGLANVIYQLAYYMAKFEDVEMTLAAFDVNTLKQKRDRLNLIGWTANSILIYSLFNLFTSIKWMFHILSDYKKYGHTIKNVPGFFIKGMFLHQSICVTKPEILHLHGVQSLFYFPLINKEIKVAMTIHGMTGNDSNIEHSDLYAKLEETACKCKRIEKLIFISNQLVHDFKKFYGEILPSVEVILNAYDSERFYYIEPIPHEHTTIATIASVCDRKGQIRVVKALNRQKKIKYICVGGGSKQEIDELVKYSVDNNIDLSYLGKKLPDEIRNILAGIDFMILPSSSEGFGLVYMEAMACGVPVILPKNLPIVEEQGIIQPGKNAILLDDCTSESIARVFSNLNQYSFNRHSVSDTVKNFTWDRIVAQYNKSFSEL